MQAESPPAVPPPVKPLKVLLITGGCCHDYAKQKDILKAGIEARAHVIIDIHHNPAKDTKTKFAIYEKEDWAAGYDCVIHNECNADVKDLTGRITKPHFDGVGSVVIHCAMHCYRDGTDEWFKYLGVTSRRHGSHYPFKVVNMDRDNPIMKDFGAEWKTPKGELYHIEKVWDTAKVLAHGERAEKNQKEMVLDPCIWTNQYGKGRVFGTTIGHYAEEMEDPIFLNFVTRGVLWSADKLNDQYLKPAPAAAPAKEAVKTGAVEPQPTLAPELEVSIKKN